MSSEFLSFELQGELYAVPIIEVREILGGAPRVTRIPGAPAFLKGLINLRGAILPIVDMREELGLPAAPYGKFTVVIIAEVLGSPVGLVVDSVVDVIALDAAAIQPPPPHLQAQVRAEFVGGLAEVSGKLVILLELDRILTDAQIGILRSAITAA